MRTTMIETILAKPRREAARTSYPDGFPVLPLVPAKRYSDQRVYELEREHVFGRSWLYVAHADQLPQPGDFVRQLRDGAGSQRFPGLRVRVPLNQTAVRPHDKVVQVHGGDFSL